MGLLSNSIKYTEEGGGHTFLVMMVILGTVASAKAYSSLAPCLMMPPYSWAVPEIEGGFMVRVASQIRL